MTDPPPGAGDETAHERDVATDPAAASLHDTSSSSEDDQDAPEPTSPAEDVQETHEVEQQAKRDVDGAEDTQGETEDDDNESEDDEEEEEDEDEDDDEPRLKYARLTQHLGAVYRNADATSAFLVAGDKMVTAQLMCIPKGAHR